MSLLFASCGSVAMADERSQRYDLPCLAPLLNRVDSAAPLNLDEAFLFGPWHAPTPRTEGIGVVDFEIATESESAQNWFNQGVALLHLFWYSEAERCFRQALVEDPDCPMLYWGLAMANERQPQRAAVFAAAAQRHSSNRPELSDIERGWLEIVSEFYADQRATFKKKEASLIEEVSAVRRSERIRQLEAMAFANPDAIEIEAFLLRQVILDHSQHGDPIASRHANDLLAQKIAAAAPQHPSRHYRLLLWLGDSAVPDRALASASDIVRVAPAGANSWRFAGEAYRAAGDLRNAVDLVGGAVRLGLHEMRTRLSMPDRTENLVSDFGTLIDAHTSVGDFDSARTTAISLVSLPRSFYLEKRHSHEQRLAGSYATGRRLLGQLHLRLERWAELLQEAESGALGSGLDGDWYSHIDSLFWKGIAHANLEQLDEARTIVEEMKDAIRAAPGSGVREDAQQWMKGLARSLRTQVEFASGERKQVPTEAQDTSWLPAEHLARLYFGAGLKEEAMALVDREHQARAGQFLTTANYADLHFKNGDIKQALFAFDEKFRRAASLAKSDLRVVERLAPVAKAMHLSARWQLPPPDHTPLPNLPAVESLEALAWTPPQVPDWTLPDHSGEATPLSKFRGEPLVANFFLSVACPFCRVQLDKFSPQLTAYREADITFIGITRDPLEMLQKVTGSAAQKSESGEQLLPFPVFADPAMGAFKSVRAFDQFDDFPMHATILLDATGRLLWSDIGHAPFNYPQALLREAKRQQGLR